MKGTDLRRYYTKPSVGSTEWFVVVKCVDGKEEIVSEPMLKKEAINHADSLTQNDQDDLAKYGKVQN